MTLDRAHSRAHRDSQRFPSTTFYVVREEQNDGTFYDTATAIDLDTHYNGLSDSNILACYEAGERQE